MTRDIYLDNSATTRAFREVCELVSEISSNRFGNPSSLHTKGIEAERMVREAREILASSLGAQLQEIIFTSGGTESNNLAVRGYLSANPRKGKRVLTTKTEHPSVLEIYKSLEQEGFEVVYLDVDRNGTIDMPALERELNGETALVSIILVNNETGALQPVEKIGHIIEKNAPGAVFHVDAVQAYGKYSIDAEKSGIGLLSMSSHKIHGPKGVGALYVKKGIRLKPILLGGGQESLLRSGTENVPGICGFGKAASMVIPGMKDNFEKVLGLKRGFLEMLAKSSFKYQVISPGDSSPYILNAAFPGVKAEVLLHHLENVGIYVSTGAACSSRKHIQSHVLKAMGCEAGIADSAIRFSFSAYENSEDDIKTTVDALSKIIPEINTSRRTKR